jgi:hypothetical protein
MSDMPPHPLKFESRLKTISGKGKPLYVTEFGARGTRPAGTDGPGTLPDGTPVEKSNRAAFQHAWFQIAAVAEFAGTRPGWRSSVSTPAGRLGTRNPSSARPIRSRPAWQKGRNSTFSSGTTAEAATSPTKHPSPWTTEARSRSTSLSTASSPSPPSRCHLFPQPELGRRPTRASRRGTTAAGGTDADAAARERHWLAVRRLLRTRAVARRVLIVRRDSPWLRLIVSASEW